MYSSIQDKYTLCVDCNDGILKPTIAGRCKMMHYKNYRAKKMLETQKEKNKFRSLKNIPENKEMAVKAGKEADTALQNWFSLQMQANEKVCSNCLKSLNHYNEWAWRGSQNHIVDKSRLNGCPSVATNILNHNVLGMWCCHSIWHENFEKQSKMPCFAAAKEKFQLFKHLIPDSELRKVNPYLL